MKRVSTLVVLLLLASICAFGQIIDPNLGFCSPPASAAACSGQPHTNPVTSGSTFAMWSFGGANQEAISPWYLFLAVPEATAGSASAPTITSASFTSISAAADAGALPPTPASEDIYSFACTAGAEPCLSGNNSMNADNLFGTDSSADGFGLEQAATGGVTPNFFEIFVYTVSCAANPCISGGTGYTFSSTPNLVAGTFLAGLAEGDAQDHMQFSTPFTTAGLVQGSTTTSGPGSGPGGGPANGPQVPEPSGIMLLGSALLAITAGLRKAGLRKKIARS